MVEAAAEIRPLGAGVNILPNAVRELAALGLSDALAEIARPISELAYYAPDGRLIWREPRGLLAGHRWPQFAVHRGRMQMLLLDALCDRLGSAAVRTGSRITGFDRLPGGRLTVTLARRDGSAPVWEAEALIGADGIRSAVRGVLYPGEGPPVWQRQVVWRGTAWVPPFAGGHTMIIAGDERWKVIVYPMAPEPDARGLLETNWAVACILRPGETVDRSGWDRTADPARLVAALGGWRPGGLDVGALLAGAAPFEQPMVDRDPLPAWSFGTVTLIGDAAHAMCPMGSNGTTQSVVDARAVAHALATTGDVTAAFTAYERERREPMSRLQLANRDLGPEVVLAAGPWEPAAVTRNYAELAGFDVRSAGAPSPYTVPVPA